MTGRTLRTLLRLFSVNQFHPINVSEWLAILKSLTFTIESVSIRLFFSIESSHLLGKVFPIRSCLNPLMNRQRGNPFCPPNFLSLSSLEVQKWLSLKWVGLQIAQHYLFLNKMTGMGTKLLARTFRICTVSCPCVAHKTKIQTWKKMI